MNYIAHAEIVDEHDKIVFEALASGKTSDIDSIFHAIYYQTTDKAKELFTSRKESEERILVKTRVAENPGTGFVDLNWDRANDGTFSSVWNSIVISDLYW